MSIFANAPNNWVTNDIPLDQAQGNQELREKFLEIDNALGLSALRADNLNLQIAMGGTPDEQVDVDAECLTLFNATFESKSIININLTIDNTAGGANGIDTGVVAIDTLYYIWVIAKVDGTVAGLFSVSSTIGTITLPADYLYARLIGAIFTDGTSDFIPGFWENNMFWYDEPQEEYSGNGVLAFANIDVTSSVPIVISKIGIFTMITNAGSNGVKFKSPDDSTNYLVGSSYLDSSHHQMCRISNAGNIAHKHFSNARAHTWGTIGYINIINCIP